MDILAKFANFFLLSGGRDACAQAILRAGKGKLLRVDLDRRISSGK
jgi:hypothetical protein